MKKTNSRKDFSGKKVTENIYLCRDGIYRWVYEMPMLANPTILFTVWKVLGVSFIAVILFVQMVDLVSGNMSTGSFLGNLKAFGLLALVFLVISLIAYVIVAAIYGWKYVVLFEMDNKQIKHIQVEKQYSKAQALGMITALAGIRSGNPTTAGTGMIAASRNSSISEYGQVKTIRSCPKWHVIKIRAGIENNQIYADGADYDFVLNYILSRCPGAKVMK